MVRLLLAIVLLCITPISFAQGTARDAAPAAGASALVVAGKVELVEGDTRFFDSSRRMRRPKVGDTIHEGESITTGADGEVHLRMEDGGYIAVRSSTQMRIVSFRAEGGTEDRSVIGLLGGSFRSVTGWIAKLGPQRAVVRTPTATIGIRGTEHEPLVIPEGSKLGEPGTYDRVHVGETEIRTKQGVVNVRPNQAGFVSPRGAQRPRVLERVPEFFRPTRNENRFTGLHTRVNQQLDQRRDERRKFIEQRRSEAKGKSADKGKADKAAKGTDKGSRSDKGTKGVDKGLKADKGAKDTDKGLKAAKADKRADKEQRKQLDQKKQRGADERQLRQRQEEEKRKMEERKRQDQRKADDKKRERAKGER